MSSKAGKDFGYKNEHPLIEERVPPPEVIRLRELLAEPQNRDIYNAAIRGVTFEDCVGIIAAHLDIALDGYYSVPDLCELLCKALITRAAGGSIANCDPRLIKAEIQERKDKIELVAAEFETVAKNKILTPQEAEVEDNSRFMLEWNCQQCDHIKLCRSNGKCLGQLESKDYGRSG